MNQSVIGKKSPMVRLYEGVDKELVTRVDEQGTIRVDHTHTAEANGARAKDEFQHARDLRADIKALKSEGAPRSEIREKVEERAASRRGGIKDRMDQGYHGFLAMLNRMVGRE